MRELTIRCDFCERVLEEYSKEGFYVIPCTNNEEVDACPRCMAILEDEVRRRLKR